MNNTIYINVRIGLRNSVQRYGRSYTRRVGQTLIDSLGDGEFKTAYIQAYKELFHVHL
jgi:hypothetical protein